MIDGLFNKGSMPVLERLVQFTNRRHKVLAHNIANINTPYFKPIDLNPDAFQEELARAVEHRRESRQPLHGDLELRDTRELRFTRDRITANPRESNQNILFHDQNNRDLERIMQGLAENTMAHNAGIQMLKNQFDMLTLAIRERV